MQDRDRELEHYRKIAEEAGRRRLREAEQMSELIVRLRAAETELERRVRERTDELRVAEERFRAFMHYLPGLAYIKDQEGRVLFASEGFRTLLGLPPISVVGRTSREVFPGDFGDRITEDDRTVLCTGAARRIEEDFGGRNWVTYKFPIQLPDGKRLLGGFTLEVTERVRAQEDQRKLERRMLGAQKLESLGVLAGGIAHDFNNILAVILGHASLAQQILPGDSPAAGGLAEIESAAQRAADLCRQMLAYAGRGIVSVRRLSLGALVSGMSGLLRAGLPAHATLGIEVEPDLPYIVADEAQIQQAVLNLVTNACESLRAPGGHVAVRLRQVRRGVEELEHNLTEETIRPGSFVELEVRDTGAGMDEATRSRVFEPFFSTRFLGRGLGLPAVLGIVRGHGGHLALESAPGHGTVVRVLLPVSV